MGQANTRSFARLMLAGAAEAGFDSLGRILIPDHLKNYAELKKKIIVAGVLNRLEIAIRLKRGLNLVLGDVGTGKTTLSRTLFQTFSGEEDYADFYRSVAGQYDKPAHTVHYRAEGRYEYSVLTFIPETKPFDLFDPDRKGHIKLYVRRVFITDEAPILPRYLRFVRGLVDSSDLPLNMSREMIQDSPVLGAIQKGVTGRLLVAGRDGLYGIGAVVEGIQQPDIAMAAEAEDIGHLLADEVLDDHLAAIAHGAQAATRRAMSRASPSRTMQTFSAMPSKK